MERCSGLKRDEGGENVEKDEHIPSQHVCSDREEQERRRMTEDEIRE